MAWWEFRSQELEDGMAVVGAALSSAYAEVHADRLKLWQAQHEIVEISGKSTWNNECNEWTQGNSRKMGIQLDFTGL